MDKKYYPIAEAAAILGISARTLKNYLPELSHGQHYQDRRRKGARKGSYFFSPDAITQYWDKRPERRK